VDELVVYQKTVELAPLEDVAKFMLIAPEKAKAQAAEIRAMRNLGIAQEVLAQKEEEQRMLNELILDAGARIGELTKEIPKATGGQPYQKDSTCDSGATSKPKTKEQIGAELGFSRTDMSRFEKLADNKDLIEQEKAQAREENRQPTRTNVLERAREREKAIKQEKQEAQENSEEEEVETSEKRKGRPPLNPGGFTKEEREQRERIASIVDRMYDPDAELQYTVGNFVETLTLNGEAYISQLDNELSDHIDLITVETLEIIDKAIETIINKIQKVREKHL